ncbi:hypothetical protein M8C21_003923, partial [Ambrosia artemisiifolia]
MACLLCRMHQEQRQGWVVPCKSLDFAFGCLFVEPKGVRCIPGCFFDLCIFGLTVPEHSGKIEVDSGLLFAFLSLTFESFNRLLPTISR